MVLRNSGGKSCNVWLGNLIETDGCFSSCLLAASSWLLDETDFVLSVGKWYSSVIFNNQDLTGCTHQRGTKAQWERESERRKKPFSATQLTRSPSMNCQNFLLTFLDDDAATSSTYSSRRGWHFAREKIQQPETATIRPSEKFNERIISVDDLWRDEELLVYLRRERQYLHF